MYVIGLFHVLSIFGPKRILKKHSKAFFKLNQIGDVRSDQLISVGHKIDYKELSKKLAKDKGFDPQKFFCPTFNETFNKSLS